MILNNIIKKYTFKKAQQLIEFAFVAPILIMFLLLIMEFGYVITIRNVISEGAKESLMQVNSKFNNLTGNAAVKKAAMETELKTSMESFLSTHGIANSSNVTVTVFTDANGVTFANFTYMYKMILTFIPNLPTIPIQSSQIINTQMLQPNSFNSGLTTAQLSSFFAAPDGALISDIAFNANDSLRQHIAILVSWYDNYNITNFAANNYARLFSWYGYDLLPANERINLRTATIEIRSPYYNGGNWLNTQIPYVWVVSALGYTQVFYTKFNATVDLSPFNSNAGWTLNECSTNDHYWANLDDGFLQAGYQCPLKWANNNYEYLYRIFPRDYDNLNHGKFSRSFGYRWCSTGGAPAGLPDCTANQSGSHTIQELALKGLTRDGVYCVSHSLNHSYNRRGNYEYVNNIGATNINSLQHYTVRTSDYNNYDGNYVINIYQPLVNNGAVNYYTAGNEFVDPAKMILNNGSNTPFFTAFQWAFRLNAGVLVAGVANTELISIYIDTDGDGIPDAWDDHPTYFDANRDNELDGLKNAVGFNAADAIVLNQGGAAYAFPMPDVNVNIMGFDYGPLISTPWDWSLAGAQRDSKKTNAALTTYIPDTYFSAFRSYNPGGGNILYIFCDGDADGAVDDLCRQYKTWDPIPANGLIQKEKYIHGTINGAVIDMDQSDELIYLNANNFSVANRVTRTPAGW